MEPGARRGRARTHRALSRLGPPEPNDLGRRKTAPREALPGELAQKRIELRPFVVVEHREEVVLELSGDGAELRERPPPLGGEAHGVAAAVVRVAAALDEPAVLELVQEPHELASVV